MLRRRFRRAQQAQGEIVEINHAGDPDQPPADLPPSAEPPTGQEVDPKWADLPDLVLIDGGKGQVNGVAAVMEELGFGHIKVVGVAKGPNRDRFDLQPPHTPNADPVGATSPALHLVQRIDEEAHRFAITYHRKLRTQYLQSSLGEVKGIGPKRKKALLQQFGSVDGIKQPPSTNWRQFRE